MIVLSLWHGRITVKPPRPTMAELADRIAAESGIAVSDLRGPNRSRVYVAPRQRLYAEAHAAGHSWPQIGRFCGGRDHTTALHGAGQHRARVAA